MEFVWLGLLSVAAFGLLGIGLGVFRVGDALRNGLKLVANAFLLVDDSDEEEDVLDRLPLDDVGVALDDSTRTRFVEIAIALHMERETEQIVGEEHG